MFAKLATWFKLHLCHGRGVCPYDVIKAQRGYTNIALPWEFAEYLISNDEVMTVSWVNGSVEYWQVLLTPFFLRLVKLKGEDGVQPLVPSPEYQREYDEAFDKLLSSYIAFCVNNGEE